MTVVLYAIALQLRAPLASEMIVQSTDVSWPNSPYSTNLPCLQIISRLQGGEGGERKYAIIIVEHPA